MNLKKEIEGLEQKLASDAKKFSKKLQTIKLPKLNIGDTIRIGKFKNRKAVIKDFGKDKVGHPTVITDKGEHSIFKFRLENLMTEQKLASRSITADKDVFQTDDIYLEQKELLVLSFAASTYAKAAGGKDEIFPLNKKSEVIKKMKAYQKKIDAKKL